MSVTSDVFSSFEPCEKFLFPALNGFLVFKLSESMLIRLYVKRSAVAVKDGFLALVFVRKLRSNVYNGRYAKIFRKYRSMRVHRTGPCAEALYLRFVHEQGF